MTFALLFLTYVLATGPGRGFRVVAAILLATTTWFKLALWHDPYSWALGIAIGGVLAAVRRYADEANSSLSTVSADDRETSLERLLDRAAVRDG